VDAKGQRVPLSSSPPSSSSSSRSPKAKGKGKVKVKVKFKAGKSRRDAETWPNVNDTNPPGDATVSRRWSTP
jgi:hypothetical protein